MTQEIRKDLSVAAIMATMVCAAVLLISARAVAEHVAAESVAAKTPEISARPR
jgi:hypothetical protein